MSGLLIAAAIVAYLCIGILVAAVIERIEQTDDATSLAFVAMMWPLLVGVGAFWLLGSVVIRLAGSVPTGREP